VRENKTASSVILSTNSLHNLYSSPSIIRVCKLMRMGWPRHPANVGEITKHIQISMGKPEVKILLGITRSKS
jgi:hypothetical protein